MNDHTLHDELMTRRRVERWAVWHGAGDRGRFATVWHLTPADRAAPGTLHRLSTQPIPGPFE